MTPNQLIAGWRTINGAVLYLERHLADTCPDELAHCKAARERLEQRMKAQGVEPPKGKTPIKAGGLIELS